MKRFLLQMAGTSASGKTTLAFAIGRATGAVVIDKDIIKGGMLDGGVPEQVAGYTAYDIFFDLTASMLSQGFNVVMDSPAFFDRIRTVGQEMAAANGATYYLIRCCLDDLDEIQRRMDAREIRSSQPTVAARESYARPGTSPLDVPHLAVDMSLPIEVTVGEALAYIGWPEKGSREQG